MREKSPSVPLIHPQERKRFQASKIQVNGNTYTKKSTSKLSITSNTL